MGFTCDCPICRIIKEDMMRNFADNIYRAIEAAPAPRASVMPPHLPSVDPLFLDAVFREFAPSEETIKEKEG